MSERRTETTLLGPQLELLAPADARPSAAAVYTPRVCRCGNLYVAPKGQRWPSCRRCPQPETTDDATPDPPTGLAPFDEFPDGF